MEHKLPKQGNCRAVANTVAKPGKYSSNLSSFRPVSLTSCLGKVLERMVLYMLEERLESHHIFPGVMSGSRCHHSSTDPVFDLITMVQQAESQCHCYGSVKRAHGTIRHAAVLYALLQVGIPGTTFH